MSSPVSLSAKPRRFSLGFAPAFAREKAELLAQKEIPPIRIPPAVERCLSRFLEEGSGIADAAPRRDVSAARLWRGVFGSIRPLLLKGVGLSLFASLCASSATLLAMRILKTGQDLGAMFFLALLIFLANGLTQAAVFHGGRLRAWVGLAGESYLVGLISRKILRLSASAAARQTSGNLKVLITSDVRNVGQFLDNFVRNVIPALTALLVITPLLGRFAGKAGICGVLLMASILPLSLGLNRISAYFQEKGQAELDRLTSVVGEWVKNARLIRYLSWDEALRSEVSAGLRRYMRVSCAQHFMACLIFGLSVCWWMISITGVVLVSRWARVPLDLAGFFGSLWLLTFLAGYFTHLPQTIRLYGQAAPAMKRVARLLAEDETSDRLLPDAGAAPEGQPVGLVFENVDFRYPDGSFAIEKLGVRIDLRKKVAMIGEIGAGKTTFLKLLCGELAPTRGRILVEFEKDGVVEARELWSRSVYPVLREKLAFVPQEPFVSSDPLARNISMGAEADAEKVLAAAYWAELEADLAELPGGVNEEIGESGVNLSGGQRQRLNLARAYFAGREYLVLDDTLSAVDAKTETVLMNRLVERNGGFLLVTHRIGELMRVEEVLVMRGGRLIERGCPADLAQDGRSHFTRVLKAYESESPASESSLAIGIEFDKPDKLDQPVTKEPKGDGEGFHV